MPNKFDIKEKKQVENKIKLLDKKVIYTKKLKKNIVEMKQKSTENVEQQEDTNPSRYGINKITNKAKIVASKGTKDFNKKGLKAVKSYKQTEEQIKGGIQKAKQKIKEIKNIKTAEEKIKQTQKVVKTSYNTAKQSTKIKTKTTKKAYNFAKNGIKATTKNTKRTFKGIANTVKAIGTGTKIATTLILGGGWILVVIVIILCMIGAFVSRFTNGDDGMELPEIVQIAKVEVEEDKTGGEKYWKWYGFDERVEWCAVFVSWCANESNCMNDKVPQYSVCDSGINWFKEQQEWQNRENYIPKPRRYYIF